MVGVAYILYGLKEGGEAKSTSAGCGWRMGPPPILPYSSANV